MDLSLLDVLRQKLIESDDFRDTLDYFFTNFGDDPKFFLHGHPVKDEVLMAAVQVGVNQMFGREVKILDHRLFRLDKYKFVHGGLNVEGRPGTVMYFESAHKGLVAVPLVPPSGETKMARFTTAVLPPPSRN